MSPFSQAIQKMSAIILNKLFGSQLLYRSKHCVKPNKTEMSSLLYSVRTLTTSILLDLTAT